MMWDGMNWGGWGMGFGWIIPLAVLALIVWAITSALRSSGNAGGNDNALKILKARYARGELSKEDFEEMRKEIS